MDTQDHFLIAKTALQLTLRNTSIFHSVDEAKERLDIAREFYEFLSPPPQFSAPSKFKIDNKLFQQNTTPSNEITEGFDAVNFGAQCGTKDSKSFHEHETSTPDRSENE